MPKEIVQPPIQATNLVKVESTVAVPPTKPPVSPVKSIEEKPLEEKSAQPALSNPDPLANFYRSPISQAQSRENFGLTDSANANKAPIVSSQINFNGEPASKQKCVVM